MNKDQILTGDDYPTSPFRVPGLADPASLPWDNQNRPLIKEVIQVTRRNVEISPYPAVPGATEAMSTGVERGSQLYPENYSRFGFGGFGDDIESLGPAPTAPATYPDTLLYRFSDWFWGSSTLVKLSVVGAVIASLYHLEKKWR